MTNYEEFDPQVYGIIEPIIDVMTQINIAQKTNPYLNEKNEPEQVKEAKRCCVHIIREANGEPRLAAERSEDGKLVCSVCGREINTQFNKDALDAFDKFNTVINQLLLFGMFRGLAAGPVKSLIDIKRVLPSLRGRLEELINFVTNETKNSETEGNIGTEYAIPNMRAITSYTAPY